MRTAAIAFLLAYATNVGAQTISAAKSDCETLMNAVLPFAQKMLKDHGEFLPYGGAMSPTGEIFSVAGYDGRERPPSMDLIKLLRDGFRQSARSGEYKATAIVYDVRVTLPSSGANSDAIAVALDHRDDYSVVVMFPYRITNGQVVLGNVIAQKGEASVFPKK